MAELKACPFCGGEAEVTREDEDHRWTVDCQQWLIDRKDPEDDCKVGIGYYDTKEEAIAAWNRRTPDALAQELAEALVKAEALTREAYTFHHEWYMGTIPPGQLNGDASWAAYELATWHRRAHQEIEPALAAAKEAGLLP